MNWLRSARQRYRPAGGWGLLAVVLLVVLAAGGIATGYTYANLSQPDQVPGPLLGTVTSGSKGQGGKTVSPHVTPAPSASTGYATPPPAETGFQTGDNDAPRPASVAPVQASPLSPSSPVMTTPATATPSASASPSSPAVSSSPAVPVPSSPVTSSSLVVSHETSVSRALFTALAQHEAPAGGMTRSPGRGRSWVTSDAYDTGALPVKLTKCEPVVLAPAEVPCGPRLVVLIDWLGATRAPPALGEISSVVVPDW